MAERKIPVASVQTIAHDVEEFDRRWPRIAAAVEAAASRGAKLIVAPEGTVPGYVIGSDPLDRAQLARAAAHMAHIARTYATTIVYGAAYLEDGATYNVGTVIGPSGDVLGHAEKQLLWHFDGRWFARGRRLDPISTPAGMLGVLICADGRIPTLARTLVERGAQVLVIPTAWVTSGRDPHSLENIQADYMAAVRARENRVPLIAANKAGVEQHAVAYCGKSAIVRADGTYIARAGERSEETLFAEIELTQAPVFEFAQLRDVAVLPDDPRPRARIGISPQCNPERAAQLAQIAALCDVDVLFGPAAADDGIHVESGLHLARPSNATMLDPTALVRARLHGVDLFVWNLDAALEPEWQVAFARTRAAELRAYLVVIDRIVSGRAFAVDPDGVVVCGTFDGFELAQFVYDRARSELTTVAPRTDVLEGLRAVESLRAPMPRSR